MTEHKHSEGVEPILPQLFPNHEHRRTPPVGRRPRSLFWPIALIGFGVLLLLSNRGLFPDTGWAVLWRFWPVALVALGVDVLIGRRTIGGAIASGVLIMILVGLVIGAAFFTEQIPALVELTKPATLQFQHVEHPAQGLESAKVSINWTSAPGYLSALSDSANLIEADVAYRGELAFNVNTSGDHADVVLDSYLQNISYSRLSFDDSNAEWNVRLSPDVAIDLWLDSGSGRCDFDLTGLNIRTLNLDSGSGSVDLAIPATSSFKGKLDVGSGSMDIALPDGVGMRVTLDDGSGSFRPDERFELVSGDRDGDGVWETAGYDSADYKIDLNVDQGSGSIRIR